MKRRTSHGSVFSFRLRGRDTCSETDFADDEISIAGENESHRGSLLIPRSGRRPSVQSQVSHSSHPATPNYTQTGKRNSSVDCNGVVSLIGGGTGALNPDPTSPAGLLLPPVIMEKPGTGDLVSTLWLLYVVRTSLVSFWMLLEIAVIYLHHYGVYGEKPRPTIPGRVGTLWVNSQGNVCLVPHQGGSCLLVRLSLQSCQEANTWILSLMQIFFSWRDIFKLDFFWLLNTRHCLVGRQWCFLNDSMSLAILRLCFSCCLVSVCIWPLVFSWAAWGGLLLQSKGSS